MMYSWMEISSAVYDQGMLVVFSATVDTSQHASKTYLLKEAMPQ